MYVYVCMCLVVCDPSGFLLNTSEVVQRVVPLLRRGMSKKPIMYDIVSERLLTAAKNLHVVNLRAYFTALTHFTHDKMPAAMEIWQGKAARDAAEDDERTKSLEQVVFVAVP